MEGEYQMYQFTNTVNQDSQLKDSFIGLAKEIFGIDFGRWENAGGWTRDYIPYCFHEDGQVIANASVNLMNLTVDGNGYEAIQIGTVMTRKDHRGQGLSEKLLMKILEDFKGKVDLIFLLADEEAMSLYRRVGFDTVDTVRHFLPADGYAKEENKVLPVKKTLEELMQLKKTALSITDHFWSKEDRHILPFYYVHGFQDMILEPLPEVTVLGALEKETFHLYDVLSNRVISLTDVLQTLVPMGAHRIELHFMPSEDLPGLYTEPDPENGFMVHKSSNVSIPKNFTFPQIITA